MKVRALAILLALCMICMAVGCAQPVVEPEDESRNNPEPTIEATENPTPSPNIEPVSSGTIQIDDGNSTLIMITLTDGVLTGSAICQFDGSDITTEREYILAAMYVFGEMDIENYNILGMSGEDLITVMVADGKQSQYSKLPSKYGAIETDADRTLEYVRDILTALTEE